MASKEKTKEELELEQARRKELVKSEVSDDKFKVAVESSLRNALDFRALGMIQPQNDKELLDRLDVFFAICVKKGQVPTIEKLALATGWTTKHIVALKNGYDDGFSRDTQRIIEMAYQTISAMDSELATSGKISPVLYIFRAKNFYDMQDKTEVSLAPVVNPYGKITNSDIIEAKYNELPIDEIEDSSSKNVHNETNNQANTNINVVEEYEN